MLNNRETARESNFSAPSCSVSSAPRKEPLGWLAFVFCSPLIFCDPSPRPTPLQTLKRTESSFFFAYLSLEAYIFYIALVKTKCEIFIL